MSAKPPSAPLALAEERVAIGRREVERARVLVRTRVEEREEVAEVELRQEEVTVERVRRDVPITALPAVREEDGVLIVPVVEERLVVTKRLILKEEIRITRRSRRELAREPVRLRSERAAVERRGRPPITQEGTPSMTDRTLTAMYDRSGAAESARDQLVGIGVTREAISIHGTGGEAAAASPADTEPQGLWASLVDLLMPDEDRHTYSEGLRRGGFLLSARVPDELEAAAAAILEGSEPIDLDHRRESWRQEGWADHPATAPASAAYGEGSGLAEIGAAVDPGAAPGATGPEHGGAAARPAMAGREDEVIQAAEEELRVGKREVGRGGVRVRSYVTERPVEQQVELRQEHVAVERRPVDRELAPGEPAFQERTIEAAERGEEAVVAKPARVTEEIGIRKDIAHETGTVRDTVRKQEVEVEDDRGTRTSTSTGTVVEGKVVDPELAGTSR